MQTNLKGRTAVVTGASMGIGRACAKALAAEGVHLAIVARRTELLDQLADEIVKAGGKRPVIITCDVMKEGSGKQIVAEARKGLGHIDILVNSAGGSRRMMIDSPDEDWDAGMTLNFTRLRQLSHAVLPDMIAGKWGRIINISGKSEPDRLNIAYPSKAAIHGWAKSLSREVGRDGITINSIPPGKIFSEQIMQKYTEEERQKFAEETSLGELGQPEDVANLVVFLSSDLARYITGTVIPVDGGFRRYAF